MKALVQCLLSSEKDTFGLEVASGKSHRVSRPEWRGGGPNWTPGCRVSVPLASSVRRGHESTKEHPCGCPGQGSPHTPNITHGPWPFPVLAPSPLHPQSARGAAALQRVAPEGCFFPFASLLAASTHLPSSCPSGSPSPGALVSYLLSPLPLFGLKWPSTQDTSSPASYQKLWNV